MSRPFDDAEQERRRRRMVDHDIRPRGVRDPRVLEAMRTVPREHFVEARSAASAYDDRPLPIGSGQTISQPYIVAKMTEALELTAGQKALEIGTGSGYAAAVLGQVAGEVWTVERHAELAESAERLLADIGCDNVHVAQGDGTLGWPEAAPFDGIVVTAGGPKVPEALLDQLADSGRLVMPVGPESEQELIVVRRGADGFEQKSIGGVRFVPLLGAQGWPSGPTGS
jgi:protein-L-isoaspartate(D-aspartate) O-methyltransferase